MRDENFFDGSIKGPNCKGKAKLDLLQKYLGSLADGQRTFAYGDSDSDRWVLAWANEAYWVRKDGRLDPFAEIAVT